MSGRYRTQRTHTPRTTSVIATMDQWIKWGMGYGECFGARGSGPCDSFRASPCSTNAKPQGKVRSDCEGARPPPRMALTGTGTKRHLPRAT